MKGADVGEQEDDEEDVGGGGVPRRRVEKMDRPASGAVAEKEDDELVDAVLSWGL